ncbi:MAG: hypothetical protein HN742_14800 [Lentisphaerae bacterium]|nr:hypothetical protein [Lentisphaerota bacterium]MBT4818629.1 hypothetical protein [Lentisphaerota bacterium]MBT5609531.1 hypothetical protein [Lentisphaerota bacterium]MBT7058437.1 hypothetical protein [Lentisphaerota bacterium]MBT7843146.1 hypothetical protein [Lentisphaerota bacterium]
MRTRSFACGVLVGAVAVGLTVFCLRPKPVQGPPRSVDPIVARVGDRVITATSFSHAMVRRGGRNPASVDRDALLEEMIERETMLLRATERKLHEDPDLIRSHQNLLIGKLRSRELEPSLRKTAISEEEGRTHYATNVAEFTQAAKARLSILFMALHRTTSEQKRERTMGRMKEGRDLTVAENPDRGFGSLAINYSEDQSTRYKGGDIGWIVEGKATRWESAVTEAGLALKSIGDVSEIITTEKGIYLVRLTDRRPSVVTPFERVEARIRHKLLLEKRKSTEKAFKAEVRQGVPIETFPDVVKAIPVPKSSQPTSGTAAPPPLPR